MNRTKKRCNDDDLRRIEALRAKAARTPYPAEAESCLEKAQQIEDRLMNDEMAPDTEKDATLGAPGAVVSQTFFDLGLADQTLLGAACSANGVRAVRGTFAGPFGLNVRQIRLFGRLADIDAALKLRDALTQHRETGLIQAQRSTSILRRTKANADLFRLAYAKQVSRTLGQTRSAEVVSKQVMNDRDSLVNATVRVMRPTVPSRLRRLTTSQSTPTWAAADSWAQTYSPAASVSQPSLTTAGA